MKADVHLTVATVVVQDSKFLMVKELDEGREVYNQPAGHWELGESLPGAAKRETHEETGWHVDVSGFLGVSLLQKSDHICYCRMSFVAEPLYVDSDAVLDANIISAEWLSFDEICSLRDKLRSPLVLQTIEAYRAGKISTLEDMVYPPLMLK